MDAQGGGGGEEVGGAGGEEAVAGVSGGGDSIKAESRRGRVATLSPTKSRRSVATWRLRAPEDRWSAHLFRGTAE